MTFDLENRGLLGRGGQGSVWLVWDRAQRRFLALKVVRCESEADARRLLGELRAFCSGAPNPWLVGWLDLGYGPEAPEDVRRAFPDDVAGPFLWLLMPYVHGPSALELARANPAFGWAEAMALGAQVAERLARRPPGKAHLDLKPENVILDLGGEAFLVDGGVAVSGSAGYAAPEQRTAGGRPGPAADAFALGRMLRRLTARDFPGPGAAPDLVPPWPEPPPDWAPERRRLCRAFAEAADALAVATPEQRTDPAAAAPELFRLSVAFSNADPKAVVAGSIRAAAIARLQQPLVEPPPASERESSFDTPAARATQDERIPPLAPRAQDERISPPAGNPLALSSRSFDKAQDRLRRRIEGRTWIAAAILLAALGICYLLFLRPPAYANPEPARIHVLGSTASCRVFPPGQLLIPPAEGPDGSAVLVETIDEPVERVSVSILYGAEVLRMEAPRPDDSCSVVLPPGTYHRSVYYGHDKSFEDTLVLRVGSPTHDRTYPHGNRAPVDPHRQAERLVNPAFGPMLVLPGPAWIDDVTWNPAQGSLAVAEVWSNCKKQLRELIYQPTGRGPSDPREHLGRDEQLCAYAKPEAKNGFEVHYSYTLDDTPP